MIMTKRTHTIGMSLLGLLGMVLACQSVNAQIAVRGKKIYTMAGAPIENGVIVITDGKIAAIGKAGEVEIPQGYTVLDAAIVTPGLVDAHSVVGLAGQFNYENEAWRWPGFRTRRSPGRSGRSNTEAA